MCRTAHIGSVRGVECGQHAASLEVSESPQARMHEVLFWLAVRGHRLRAGRSVLWSAGALVDVSTELIMKYIPIRMGSARA